MKKTAYIAPKMQTLTLVMEQMIANSPTGFYGGSSPTGGDGIEVDPDGDEDYDEPNRSRGRW